MPRYKLTLAYDGTDFCGWQKQFPHQDAVPPALILPPPEAVDFAPHHAPPSHDDLNPRQISPAVNAADDRPRVELRTVQSVLERAVHHVVREPVVINGSSRTDAGVHAKGQVAAFTCSDAGGRTGGWPAERGTRALVRALNARLPSDVLVTSAEIVPPEFNPVLNAVSKAYSYHLWTSEDRPLWNRRTVMHLWRELSAEAMHDAAQAFVGEHDFAAFAAAGHGRLTTVRTVFACSVRRISPEYIIIDITGSGFLWNMVRIIAGTLVDIGAGKRTIDQIHQALRSGDRLHAGPTLPPTGLCLEWIKYGTKSV